MSKEVHSHLYQLIHHCGTWSSQLVLKERRQCIKAGFWNWTTTAIYRLGELWQSVAGLKFIIHFVQLLFLVQKHVYLFCYTYKHALIRVQGNTTNLDVMDHSSWLSCARAAHSGRWLKNDWIAIDVWDGLLFLVRCKWGRNGLTDDGLGAQSGGAFNM